MSIPTARKPLVYLIDDDLVLSRILEQRLQGFGCEVHSFTEPDALYRAFQQRRPQLMFVDINLGEGESGFDIITKIRTEFKSDIPILILSGDRDPRSIAHGLEVGASDYLVKPYSRSDFQDIVSLYISAEHLQESGQGLFQPALADKEKSRLRFQVAIEEVHPAGLTLISDHLIKKGTAFYLQGEGLREITPGCERIFVSVVGSSIKMATKQVVNQKKYQIRLEIDASQESALEEIRQFLNSKYASKKFKQTNEKISEKTKKKN